MRRGLLALQEVLSGTTGPFAMGAALSLVDVCLVPQLFATRRFGVPLDGLDALLAVENHCQKLPAFQKAHPEQQPDCPT